MYELKNIRNIGIIAHIDAGKTTTTEQFLFYAGKTHKMGYVDEGTAAMDWMEQEKERGITISAAATAFFWKDCKINIIDTPGHVDFTVEVERTLRVLDGAVGVFCAVGGVQPQSETVWRQSERYKIPKLIYINKMDRTGADFFKVVDDIKNKLNANTVVIEIPIIEEDKFIGIIDIIRKKAFMFESETSIEVSEKNVPDNVKEQTNTLFNNLVEKLSDVDMEIMEDYVNGVELTPEKLQKALRKATLARQLFPVFCGSSLKNKGVTMLLDGVVDYLPSPVDIKTVSGINPKTKKENKVDCNIKGSLTAYVFKLYNDVNAGKLFFTRIYSGRLKKGDIIYNWSTNSQEKVMKIFEVHTNKYLEKEEALAGEIVVLSGLKKSYTGNTLSEKNNPIIFESVKFPQPVIYVSAEPKIKSDYEKLYNAFFKISEEDPTLSIKTDEETGQIVIMGMGELHIDVTTERLRREQKLDIRLGKPEVAYRETITQTANGEGEFIKQAGNKGHYGHAVLRVEPLDRGGKFIFEDVSEKGKVPMEFIYAIEEGVREALEAGPLLGTPMMDIKVELIDTSFHATDSNEIAYKIAGSMAFREAVSKAAPVLLEPIMKISITAPEEFMGAISSDINLRGGRVERLGTLDNIRFIEGFIPLRNIFGYATILRSLTQGRGNYIIEPSFYEVVPPEELKRIRGS
jgi:elongation factor G